MTPIITVTFSPCIDKSFSVVSIVPDNKLRCSQPKLEPGGGGINVARAIRKLGGDAIALYPVGGYAGKCFEGLLKNEGVRGLGIETGAATRENLVVFEESTRRQFRFVMPPTQPLQHDWRNILAAIEKSAKPGFIVISGSLPMDAPVDLFRHISIIARNNKAQLIVDTSGISLERAIEEDVFLIKPNLSELGRLVKQEVLELSEALDAARRLLSQTKCQVIVVSMGSAGALLVTRTTEQMIEAPRVKHLSTVGAGDSMVAGIVWSLSQGESIDQAVRYGVACGTAATMNPGTELCRKSDADFLYHQLDHDILYRSRKLAG